jgi:hypothetical protein
LVVVAPEESGLTPDDLVIVPAWTKKEVEALWDWHDGRNVGTMVVSVYVDQCGDYIRDTSWGLLGQRNRTGRAKDDDVIGGGGGEQPSLGFNKPEDGEPGQPRQINLSDLVGPAILKKIDPIMAKIKAKKLDLGEGKTKILEILQPIRDRLEAKGVLADYLAWYLTWLATQI